MALILLLLASPACLWPQSSTEAKTLPEAPLPQLLSQIATSWPDSPIASEAAQLTQPDPLQNPSQTEGSIAGTVVDSSGAAIDGATATLQRGDAPQLQEARSGTDGQFRFSVSGAGAFHLTLSASGFAPSTVALTIAAGQAYMVPQISLAVAGASTEVQVRMTRQELAQVQLDAEVKQRFLGFIPNFYTSYDPQPQPLTPKQKFTLAGRFMLDPVSFGLAGLTAAVQQANNDYSGFGRGPGGYGKRYAAATGTFFDSVILGSAVLPSIFKQDPRYFYKGTGTIKSRILYAIANSVVCKGDNGHWQFNYTSIGGGLAAGAISNLYYPAQNRDGVETTFVNAAIGIAESAAGNIAQELLFRKLTSHSGSANPSSIPKQATP